LPHETVIGRKDGWAGVAEGYFRRGQPDADILMSTVSKSFGWLSVYRCGKGIVLE
jgi:hypothetical protein